MAKAPRSKRPQARVAPASRPKVKAKPKAKPLARKVTAAPTPLLVMVATRKGLWLLRGDTDRLAWRIDGPHFLGQTVHHAQLDPRDGRTLLAAVSTGHLGPTLQRSTDAGKTWAEVAKPPAFRSVENGTGRSVKHTFWLTPAHAAEPGVWYAGTSPQGLFRSDDGGNSWTGLPGINDAPAMRAHYGSEQDGTPDGPKLHSVIVDPRDPAHLYVGMSSGGVHESRDRGATWTRLLDGLEVVDGFDRANPMFHDPHCMVMAPSNPNRLWQQNHCGIYRLDRPGTTWKRVGKAMPKTVGDIGFPMVVHPRDPDVAWVFPMDGGGVWPRTAPAGQPAAYGTRDGGRSWQRLADGLPASQAWWTIKRQAMACDQAASVGLYVGNTAGEVWLGREEGKRWDNVLRHLPEIYAIEVGAPR